MFCKAGALILLCHPPKQANKPVNYFCSAMMSNPTWSIRVFNWGLDFVTLVGNFMIFFTFFIALSHYHFFKISLKKSKWQKNANFLILIVKYDNPVFFIIIEDFLFRNDFCISICEVLLILKTLFEVFNERTNNKRIRDFTPFS